MRTLETPLIVSILIFAFRLVKPQLSSLNQNDWGIEFNETPLIIDMNNVLNISIKVHLFNSSLVNSKVQFFCESSNICQSTSEVHRISNTSSNVNITIRGLFLGKSNLCANLSLPNGNMDTSSECLQIIVIRDYGLLDKLFSISIGFIVFFVYISFGAALDIQSIKNILMKPIGPTIAFFCQFLLMPLLSFCIGYIFFYDNVNLWLGIFFTGASPGGGASNMWTLLLKGNVNLSIIMTSFSNLAAFAMMPLWIFTLGKVIFDQGNLGVPYANIAIFSFVLIVPIGIGIILKKMYPKLATFLVKILKYVIMVILIYMKAFGIYRYWYIFELFSWEILLAGCSLPWIGFLVSYIFALFFKQNKSDCLTISIETGLQNTGVAIFLLRFSLEQPEADLTTVIPIAVANLTVVPLIIVYVFQLLCRSFKSKNKKDNKVLSDNIKPEEVTKMLTDSKKNVNF